MKLEKRAYSRAEAITEKAIQVFKLKDEELKDLTLEIQDIKTITNQEVEKFNKAINRAFTILNTEVMRRKIELDVNNQISIFDMEGIK